MPAARHCVISRARIGLVTAAAAAVVGTGAMGTAPAVALAASPTHVTASHSSHSSRATASSRAAARTAKAKKVIHWVARQKGKPYQYGAAGPHAFDCSGLVRYVFQHALHRSLPHNADEQRHDAKRIWHLGNLRPGDLVFETDSSGYAYHVGIYAGHGYFWHAPHSGTVVKRQKLYSARWRFGRLIH